MVEVVDNAFCPTGKGGGVDPTCSPKEITAIGVRIVTNDLKESWGYHGEVEVTNGEGRVFEKGGLLWKEGGNCHLESGKVTIHGLSAGEDIGDVKRLVAHEFMHGTYERVVQQFRAEQKTIGDLPDPLSVIKMSGEIKPGAESQYPTYARMQKFVELSGDKLKKDDGVTEYSKAYWRDHEVGKVSQHIAVHETLAEIAGHHEKTGEIIGSRTYKDFYKATRNEYEVITGKTKKRKGPGLVRNQFDFSYHEMYFDSNWKPTAPESAKWIRIWDGSGSSITARKT